MSTNQIQKVFNYQGANVRSVIIDGEPWFVARDICRILELSNPTMALENLDSDERAKFNLGRQGETNIVNEPGLYSLILRSRKPEAKQFKRWITHEVLPSIRKHGIYMTKEVAHEAIENVELFLSRALLIAKDKIDVLQIQLDDAAPKVLLADSIIASETSIPVGDMAKILRQHGIEIGQNRLYEWLRENDYLMKTGKSRNLPTQKAMELELFEIEETAYCYGNTLASINRVARVTGKGQLYFVNLFRKKSA